MKLTKRRQQTENTKGLGRWTQTELEQLEQTHSAGLSVQQIVELFTDRGERLSEATFRKYVQLGLLPRSRRVGSKGKHRGSRGLYPATTVRQLAHIRRLMAQGFTIDEIQREFLFVRGDIEALGRQLARVYDAIEEAVAARSMAAAQSATLPDPLVQRELDAARDAGAELLDRLEAIERRLTLHARMARAAV